MIFLVQNKDLRNKYIQKRRYYDRLLTQKSAELSQSQRTAQEVDMQPNPCAAKYLPLKEWLYFSQFIVFKL